MVRKVWMRDPDYGGKKIPFLVQLDVQKRIEKVAVENYKGNYSKIVFRFRGQFCYVDALPMSHFSGSETPEGFNGSLEEYREHLENDPIHLCRLRYFGDERWSFSFYTYSDEKYKLTVFHDGSFFGKPEAAFLQSAGYLDVED